MSFIIGRKIEMSQQFQEDGSVVPVTLVKAMPNVVSQVRTIEKDGYIAVQLATDTKSKLNKPEFGHLKDLEICGTLKEFRINETELKRGDIINVSVFEPGMKVDVTGVSKGRGFAGVMKRHGFKGGPATHGNKDQSRAGGSIGSKCVGPVMKGKRMPGRMGTDQVTVKNLRIISVDTENNILAIKGAVPGARGGVLYIKNRESKHLWQR